MSRGRGRSRALCKGSGGIFFAFYVEAEPLRLHCNHLFASLPTPYCCHCILFCSVRKCFNWPIALKASTVNFNLLNWSVSELKNILCEVSDRSSNVFRFLKSKIRLLIRLFFSLFFFALLLRDCHWFLKKKSIFYCLSNSIQCSGLVWLAV